MKLINNKYNLMNIKAPKTICRYIRMYGIEKKDGTKFTPSECEDIIFTIKKWCGLIRKYKQ